VVVYGDAKSMFGAFLSLGHIWYRRRFGSFDVSGLDGWHCADRCRMEYAPSTLQKFTSSSEDGGSRFLRNFGMCLAGCTTSRATVGCAAFFRYGVCVCQSSDGVLAMWHVSCCVSFSWQTDSLGIGTCQASCRLKICANVSSPYWQTRSISFLSLFKAPFSFR